MQRARRPVANTFSGWLWLASLLILAGCAGLASDALQQRFGPAQPTRFDEPSLATADTPSYTTDIKPILDRRCVVCHGCYDAPCQLKLSSWAGIARGLTPASIYGELRLTEAPLTRLGLDAQRASQWRERGFSPVLNEHRATPDAELQASLLWRSLALKAAQPHADGAVLPSAAYDFSLDRQNSCPRVEAYDAYATRHPHGGMPYGLPGLSTAELALIQRWLLAGAPDLPAPALPEALTRQVARWEAFLNGDTPKAQLVGRYLYEHLFLGTLMFDGDSERHGFKLVRSASPPGQPVQVIATRRPFDDPGVARPFYRLVWDRETRLAKTHLPYTLSAARLARWQAWFVDAPFDVPRQPGYAPDVSANPFKAFAALPLTSRYRFLLDDSSYFVNNFIKGPVCRGQTALDVINDRFWVFFVDPAEGANDDAAQLVAREADLLRMPAVDGSNSNNWLAWRAVAQSEDALLAAKTRHMARVFGPGQRPIDLNFIWRGEGHNPNAALTVFRHFDSATVEQGLIGEPPKTAWVIGYPLLERIYYLLVAGFDVYGNTSHQLQTRLAMDFLRMEGESHFLMLLPQAARAPLRDDWYRGASEEVKRRVIGGVYRFEEETGIPYPPGVPPQAHLFTLLKQRLAPVLNQRHALTPHHEPDARALLALQALGRVRGEAVQWLPEVVVLRVEPERPGQAARYYTLLNNSAHLNVSSPFREGARRVPAEDTITVGAGFIGAYPNALWHSTPTHLSALVQAVAGLRSESDYRALADRYAIRRTQADFWAASDALMAAYQAWAPAEAGLLDWSRLENR
jgi:hypothetical protein